MLLLCAWVGAKTCTMLLGGDIMLNGVQPSARVWKSLRATVREADVSIANLEIPLTDARTPTPNKSAEEIKRRDQFVLKADPRHTPYVADAGWDMVSLGNNHAMDYGPQGLKQMLAFLDKAGPRPAGAGSTSSLAVQPAVYACRNGTRVALLSAMAFMTYRALAKVTPATRTSPGVNGLDLGGSIDKDDRAFLKDWITSARLQSDLVVVGMHWGVERKTIPTAYQVALGRALVDAGADVVWGNHPHVLQGAELYKGVPILYSCANLISALPSKTALFRLTFAGQSFKTATVLPAAIAKGSVKFESRTDTDIAKKRFAGLCATLVKKFPNRQSVPLRVE